MGPLRGLGLVGVGLGLSLVYDGARRLREAAARTHRMVRTKATVVRVRREDSRDAYDGRRTTFYYPTVRFTTADGEAVEVERDWGSSWAPADGAQVDVYFEPEAPRGAMIGSPAGGTPRILALLGAMLVVVGAVFVIVGCSGGTTSIGDAGTDGRDLGDGSGGGGRDTVKLGSLDETCDGAFGLTGRSIADALQAEYKATFTYQNDAGGPTVLTIRTKYDGGDILCTKHWDPPPGSGAPSMPASLALTIRFEFETADGRFKERLADATVTRNGLGGGDLQLAATEPFSAIQGTYVPSLSGFQTLQLGYGGTLSGTTTTGQLMEQGSTQMGNVGMGRVQPVGQWK